MAFASEQEIEEFGEKITREHGFKFNVDGTRPKWTGWKYGGWANYDRPDEPHVRDYSEGFCAQLVWYKWGTRTGATEPSVLYGYFVNLPGMQADRFERGACFDIGDQRVRQDTPPEELDAMIEAGWKKLIELVKKEEGVDISNLREGYTDGKPSEVPQG